MNPVLMLTRNSLELTKRSVESVLAQDIDVTLFCLDNDSTDGTHEYLFENPDVVLMKPLPPRGVARGWNQGLNTIFMQDVDAVLVCNNDLVLRKDTYREMLADGGGFVTGVGVGEMAQIEGEFVKGVTDHPDFSCFLIRREVWEDVGPFDEHFEGAYCEDLDYHVRMHRHGIRAVNIGMPFYHVTSGTIKNSSPEEGYRINQQADRNREYFRQKWGVGVGTSEYYSLFIPKNFGIEESLVKEKG